MSDELYCVRAIIRKDNKEFIMKRIDCDLNWASLNNSYLIKDHQSSSENHHSQGKGQKDTSQITRTWSWREEDSFWEDCHKQVVFNWHQNKDTWFPASQRNSYHSKSTRDCWLNHWRSLRIKHLNLRPCLWSLETLIQAT